MMNNQKLQNMFKSYLNGANSIYKVISCNGKDLSCKIVDSKCICSKNKQNLHYLDDYDSVVDFDILKNYFCKIKDVKPIGSCDGIVFLSNDDIALIEFKLGCEKLNQGKNLRDQIFCSLEIIYNVLNQPDKFRQFAKEHIICYIIFDEDKLNHENKLEMELAKDAIEKLKVVGVDYFKKFLLKDIKVLYKDDFKKIKSNWDKNE